MSKLTDKLTALIAENIKEPSFSKAVEVLNDVMELERALDHCERTIRLAKRFEAMQAWRLSELEIALSNVSAAPSAAARCNQCDVPLAQAQSQTQAPTQTQVIGEKK